MFKLVGPLVIFVKRSLTVGPESPMRFVSSQGDFYQCDLHGVYLHIVHSHNYWRAYDRPLASFYHLPSARAICRKQKELEKCIPYRTLHQAITSTYFRHETTSVLKLISVFFSHWNSLNFFHFMLFWKNFQHFQTFFQGSKIFFSLSQCHDITFPLCNSI